jgi:hypothetical protein
MVADTGGGGFFVQSGIVKDLFGDKLTCRRNGPR